MNFSAALVFIGFFALIGFAVWFTGTAWALLGLLLTPSYKADGDTE